MRDSATSLVHEHQEDVRHIHDLRRREREMMDERLKSRLISKKRSLEISYLHTCHQLLTHLKSVTYTLDISYLHT